MLTDKHSANSVVCKPVGSGSTRLWLGACCGSRRFTQANIPILLVLTSNERARRHVTFMLQINNH
jgi:hypothetical protein